MNEKRPTKLDIEYDHDFPGIDTFDELIAHFQLLKSNYEGREDIVNQTIEFDCDSDEERMYMSIYTTRLETEEERKIRNQIEHQKNIRLEKDELDKLKNLMNKYPKEVLSWVLTKPEK